MKKSIVLLLVTLMTVLSFTGCKKEQECALCGTVKPCKEVDTALGTDTPICDDCMDTIRELQREFFS